MMASPNAKPTTRRAPLSRTTWASQLEGVANALVDPSRMRGRFLRSSLLAGSLLIGCHATASDDRQASAASAELAPSEATSASSSGVATAKAATKAAAPIKVETAPVSRRAMPRYLTLTGSILADRSSEVAANVSGRITETRVERGDEVKRGDILALVDPKAAGLQAEAARAQSLSAASQVDLARQDCARADALFREGALAKSEYERQKTACSQLLYSSDAARAQAELARKLARDTAIRAPMSGTIGDRFVNVGEYVLPSSRIAAIYAIDQVRISISVPEVAVGQIRQGQSLDIHVSAYPTRTTPAIVRYVSPALRPATRDLIIEAIAKNPDRTLMPGMFATVLLELGRESQLTVPRSAIKVDGTVRRVFLARDNEAYEVVVQTGVEDQGQVAVLDSVDASDRVILNPPVELRDGSPITSL